MDKGLIRPFESLTNGLSGTVGIGNIAAVSIGIFLGGAGSGFWLDNWQVFKYDF